MTVFESNRYRFMLLKNAWDVSLILILLTFASWLMFHTFNYNYKENLIVICGKIWSDFGANLPLIRSFSFGNNWPPEYPIYPGEPINYHYLFYMLVGLMERIGVPIHMALNIPSIAGLFGFMAMIYFIAMRLFKDRRIATLSVVFFVFNGSLAFWQYFATKAGFSWEAVKNITNLQGFIAGGPWDGGPVMAFWHLNVFINQRHFCVALGLLLVFTYVCLKLENSKRSSYIINAILFGIIFGFLPILHKPIMLILAVVMSVFFLTLPYLRWFLIAVGSITVSVIGLLFLFSFNPLGAPGGMAWFPGGFAHSTPNVNYIKFFWYQFGLHNILIPIGILIAPRRVKIVMLPAVIILVFAFTFRISNDVMLNHKFINYSLIMLQMLSAYVFVAAYSNARAILVRAPEWLKHPGKFLVTSMSAGMLMVLTLSGVIELFPIINDCKGGGIRDVQVDPISKWYFENTPKDAVILNTRLIYDSASTAGRKVFLGWPYFTASAGYDVAGRFNIAKEMYAGEDPKRYCPLLKEHNISYVAVEDMSNDPNMVKVNVKYFTENFTPAYTSDNNNFWIFETKVLCAE